jgi:hypothetical protein
MNGLTTFSKTGNAVYIPHEALDILKTAVDSLK